MVCQYGELNCIWTGYFGWHFSGSCKLKDPGEGTLGPAVDIDYCYVGLSIFGRDLSFQIFRSYVTWKATAAQQGFAAKISLKIPIWRKRAEEVGLLS